jgi:predicted DNA-binding antitoxin AbrB/MazE fold protein
MVLVLSSGANGVCYDEHGHDPGAQTERRGVAGPVRACSLNSYENGVLRPAHSLPLQEKEKVEIVIRKLPSNAQTLTAERREALERLLAQHLPVADWDQMEQEIIRGAME